MNYRLVTKLCDVKEYLSGAAVVAFDFETAPLKEWRNTPKSALDPHKAQIVGISLCVSEGNAVYIPLRHVGENNFLEQAQLWQYLKEDIFENKSVIKVAHNLAFESMFLYALGIIVQEPCYDTFAASQLTQKGFWQFRGPSDSGLKTLAKTICNAQLPDFLTVTGGKHFDELSPNDLETINYACSDADFTLRLYYIFNKWFDDNLPAHKTIVEKVESPSSVYVGLMKYNGLHIDRTTMFKKQQQALNKISELQTKIKEIIGDVDIGANASTSSLKEYLFKHLKLPVMKSTAKFQEAMDDEAFILLKEWCSENTKELVTLFGLLQDYRKWSKLKSTYIDGYLQHINPATDRIHPDLISLGTETGRFASRNPNLQNCPRQDNDPIGIREFFVANVDNLLLSLDFSQIELRVGAFYCRDEKMLDVYRTGGDIHAQTTSVIYNIPFKQAIEKDAPQYKERRTIAKNCNFGIFYGLYPSGLQKTLHFKAGLKTNIDYCEAIIKNMKSGYPGLSRWQEETKLQAEKLKYSETWLGRRRYIMDILSKDWGKKAFAQRCSLNTPIQGTAADILKLALGRIISGLPSRPWLRPLLQIHDELLFEVPKDRVKEATLFIKKCMEAKPFESFDVPIVAEAAVGINFGKMKEME